MIIILKKSIRKMQPIFYTKKNKKLILLCNHPYFHYNFFGSQAIWLGSHPEASGFGSSKRRASRGISGFSSLGKIHGLTNQFA